MHAGSSLAVDTTEVAAGAAAIRYIAGEAAQKSVPQVQHEDDCLLRHRVLASCRGRVQQQLLLRRRRRTSRLKAHKRVGNLAFQAGAYEEAVKAYTQAIEAKPNCAVWYSNRAVAYLKVCCLLFFWHWRSYCQAVRSPGQSWRAAVVTAL